MDNSDDGLVSKEELIRLAIKLRQDLLNYEDKLGSRRDFAELMGSANALVVAILEPVAFTSPPWEAAQSVPFPRGRRCIPGSLH